jgi:hypothetical protein
MDMEMDMDEREMEVTCMALKGRLSLWLQVPGGYSIVFFISGCA